MAVHFPTHPKSVAVSFLGKMSLSLDGITISEDAKRSRKIWSVLAYFIVHRERSISHGELIEQFWADENSSNPMSALKTLISRIRTLLEPLCTNELTPILSQRGSYRWNVDLHCVVDVEQFEQRCKEVKKGDLSPELRIEFYAQTLSLYNGDFLAKLSSELWVIPYATHYHMLYVSSVSSYATLLQEANHFETMTEICVKASKFDYLDEQLHILIIRSLILQNKNAAALAHYDSTTDLLYRNLGVHPSEELSALYMEIMSRNKTLETDLQIIQSKLNEESRTGAFLCEYGFFKEIYQLEARRSIRSGTCTHVALVTMSNADSDVPNLSLLHDAMGKLGEVLATKLRAGDVISKCSAAQYIILLPSANFENSIMALERTLVSFCGLYSKRALKLS